MSWQIRTIHTSRYTYEWPVVVSHNELRLTPVTRAGQVRIDSSLLVSPTTRLYGYTDYFGASVMAFGITEPHTELTVVGSSVVATPQSRTEPNIDLGWDQFGTEKMKDDFGEYLQTTPLTAGGEAIAATGPELTSLARPLEAVEVGCEWIRSSMVYRPGTTAVSTAASEAWRARQGVCQDFADIAIALFRSCGIPTRYVSGYLYPIAEAVVGERVQGAGHAWIECWLGSWRPFDPTHGIEVGERHVEVARGRDYRDVAPFRGVYQGGRLSQLDVTVELTRLA